MDIKTEEITRAQVAEFLPAVLEKALASYNKFMEQDISDQPEKFSKHHSAGKVAIAHVQLLLKLAQWANMDVENDSQLKNSLQVALKETNKKEFLDLSDIGEES